MRYGEFAHGAQITLVRRTPKPEPGRYDDYGNVQYQVHLKIVRGVAIYPLGHSENDGIEFERTTSMYTCVLPYDVEVNNIDYVLWAERQYEIAGEPARYQSPHTGRAIQTITLRRVEG